MGFLIVFRIDIASNSPEGMMVIGRSPGESVYVKAGAVDFEPELIEDSSGWLRMDIDKGNQASEGQDMIKLGIGWEYYLDRRCPTNAARSISPR